MTKETKEGRQAREGVGKRYKGRRDGREGGRRERGKEVQMTEAWR